MGDPFSIATGVAGLVSLGITVCDGLHTYFSAIRDRKDDLAIVTQNAALLKFHIFAVQSSASKLDHRHSPAMDGLQLSLTNCETQLKYLGVLLNELQPTEDPSLAKEIWRKQKLIARYPFDRKKLVQLEEYLSRANTTLSSFIQALNLDINIRMSDDMEAFKACLETLDINTQTTLRTITTRLNVIGPKVEPSTLQVLPSRNVTASSSNSIVLQKTAVGVAEMRTYSPKNKRAFEDLTDAHYPSRYQQNAEIERRLCKKLADMDCTCGASKRKTSDRPASRTYRFWGGLTVSRQGDVRANHRPGCIFFQKSKRNISRTSLTYFGFLSFFSQSFTVSLTQEYSAGPYSVSFELQPCNVVESSLAFQVFNLSQESVFEMFAYDKSNLGPDRISENIIHELRAIYGSGKATPFDVDQYGNNIAVQCLRAWLVYFTYNRGSRSSNIAINAFCRSLTYLADIGVPIGASNFRQFNIFTLSTQSFGSLWILPRLYGLVTSLDTNCHHADLAHNRRKHVRGNTTNGEQCVMQVTALCEHSEICEDIGFSELFLIIIKRDYEKLQALLAEEDNSSNISHIDFCLRNILHASSNWPDGLRLLLQRDSVRLLMDMPSAPYDHLRPLDYALFYSKTNCSAPDQWTECEECTCYFAVQLLLEADCNVTVDSMCPQVLAGCSLKARRLFFEHFTNRRERLRNAAIAVLPEETLRQYGLTANSLPDKIASLIWNELQETKEQRDHLSVNLIDSLKPYRGRRCEPQSFFDFPYPIKVVELAIEYDLTPMDELGVPPLLSGIYSALGAPSEMLEELSMKYLDWVLQYDLKLEILSGPFRLSNLHRMAIFIGDRISSFFSQYEHFGLPPKGVTISGLRDSKILLPVICHSRAQCSVPCPCSSGMFAQPLAYILPAMLGQRNSDPRVFFENIGENIKLVVHSIDLLGLLKGSPQQLYMAKCAIHILTMMSLGVRHLEICLVEVCGCLGVIELEAWEQDWKEVLDEDRNLINELQTLDEEFGGVFDRHNVSIAEFLSGYWLTRMEEVVAELNKPLSVDDRYNLLEAGVVLDEDSTNGSERCVERTE